jgi:fused signal recognition particle receptor
VTKLDGTARGGAVFGIRDQLGLPVRFIGTGETMDALEPFDPETFVDALLSKGPVAAS